MNGSSKIRKVSLVSGIYPPDIGGPANYVPAFETYLNRRKIHTTVISLSENPKNYRSELNKRVFIDRNLALPLRFLLTVSNLIIHSIGSNHIFANGLHEEAAVANLVLKKNLTMKIVGDPVWERYRNQSGMNSQSLKEFNLQRLRLVPRLRRKFLTWALNKATLVVCPSPELCKLVESWGVKTPVFFVPNGVEPVKLISEERPIDVIFVGRLVKWKNVNEIISSVSKLGLSLTVIGDGPERTKLEELSSQLNADVTFEGQVKESEISSFLTKAKCFVLVSDYEGMSFALLQAMNCGAVAVVSDVEGNLQIIKDKHTGIVAPLHNQEQLNEAINLAVNNPQFSKKIAITAKKLCNEEFNLQNNFGRMFELFQKGF
jgi:glycosyltransferase involved in cell wall biosynthesis